jgi:hemoglobin-like flavoprotein
MNIGLLRESFELVVGRAPDVTHGFYQLLFERHPQVVPLFGRTDLVKQEKMLTRALVALMDHLEDSAWLTTELPALGAKHVAYGVTEEMYGWVGDCLLTTFAEICASAWTPSVADAWREAYGAVAGLMQSGAQAQRVPVTQASPPRPSRTMT